MHQAEPYLAYDRRQALSIGADLPQVAEGSLLSVDISGFTQFTETLLATYGSRGGAEVLAEVLNETYSALITQVDAWGGTVVSFSGDAMLCWFANDSGYAAVGSAGAIHRASHQLKDQATMVRLGAGLQVKTVVVVGQVRRFGFGDPADYRLDTLSGPLLERLAMAERQASPGEIVVDQTTAANLGSAIELDCWIEAGPGMLPFAKVSRFRGASPAAAQPSPGGCPPAALRPWIAPVIWKRLTQEHSDFLTELRPAVAVFLQLDDRIDDQSLEAYIQSVQQIVTRYEGLILQITLGEKGGFVYMVFGAPITHEDDVMRVLLAAQALCDAPAALNRSTRIGIAQGLMRTGSYGGPTRRTYGALGDATNLAARLMQVASPGQILVDDRTAAAAPKYRWAPLPPLRLKGKAAPVNAFELVQTNEQPALEHMKAYQLPLVGRTDEYARLGAQLGHAQAGSGRLVGISGEAGIGKTRLAAAVLQHAERQGWACYGGEAPSYGRRTPYVVWRMVWWQLFELPAGADMQIVLDRLSDLLAAIDPDLVPRLPLLGPVLQLDIPDTPLTKSLALDVQNSSRKALLVTCLRWCVAANLRRGRATLLVLDDLHWSDELSQALIEQVGRIVAQMPLLLLLIYRTPDTTQRAESYLSRIELAEEIAIATFGQADIAALVALKTAHAGRSFAPEVQAMISGKIHERTQGNPFYAEELLNYLFATNADLSQAATWEHSALPSSVQRLILSRVDQQDVGDQQLIKVASVIGRLFSAEWLRHVAARSADQDHVLQSLAALEAAELIAQESLQPELRYLFKHIITQEAIYESISSATQASLHERIAAYIEGLSLAAQSDYIYLLAYHYGRTGNLAKQQEFLGKAGAKARAAYANQAALQYYQRLLAIISDQVEIIDTRLRIGNIMELTGDWAGAKAMYKEALDQAAPLADPLRLAQCQLALGVIAERQGDLAEALDWLGQAHQTYLDSGDRLGLVKALDAQGQLHWHTGDLDVAREFLNEALRLVDSTDSQHERAAVLHTLGNLEGVSGNYAQAEQYYTESLRIREALNDIHGSGKILHNLGTILVRQHKPNQALDFCRRSIALYQQVGDRFQLVNGKFNVGALYSEQGNYDDAYATMHEVLAIAQEIGSKPLIGFVLDGLGTVRGLQRDYASARSWLEQALVLKRSIGDKVGIANALHNLGALIVPTGDYATATGYLQESQAICEANGYQRGLYFSLFSQAVIARNLGSLADAERVFRRCLATALEVHMSRHAVNCLIRLADLALHEPAARDTAIDMEHIVGVLAYVDRSRREDGWSFDPLDNDVYEQVDATVRSMLSAQAFDAAWAKASSLDSAALLSKLVG
ncbi:MAG TPA: tetratricopeptide repeat protein [Herpetosiphonaceae bacterium]|nr:tetratricopeptide repeat protein [Herpetosiphonaceae bacterium]